MSYIKDLVKKCLKLPVGIWFKHYVKKQKKIVLPIIYLIGTPLHSNLGDQAIAHAEIAFFKKYFPKHTIVEVPYFIRDYFDHWLHIVRKYIQPQDLICLHGGGNMGVEYFAEEEARRKTIQFFPDYRITMFPQTMDFGLSEMGERELKKTQEIYSNHSSLILFAREERSYQLMKAAFPDNRIYLSPDIVLFLDESKKALERQGVMLVLRNDAEGVLEESSKDKLQEMSQRYYSAVRFSDTVVAQKYIFPNQRSTLLQQKLDEFRSAELVVTDRLHGMVFSAITGTPCIVFSNYNHKIQGTYKWISYLPFIKFAHSLDEFNQLLEELQRTHGDGYKNESLMGYFEQIRDSMMGLYDE